MLHYLLGGYVQKVVLGIILIIKSLRVTPVISINPCEPKHAAHSSVIRGSVANASGCNYRDEMRCMI